MPYELVPKARAIALLANLKNTSHQDGKAYWQDIARSIGVPIESISASAESDFEPVIASLSEKHVDALYVVADTLFGSYAESLGAVLARHKMPALFTARRMAVAGGLIAYGGNYTDAQRQIGIYVGRILKGEKPADLP